ASFPPPRRPGPGQVRRRLPGAAAGDHRHGLRRLEGRPGQALRRRRRLRQDLPARRVTEPLSIPSVFDPGHGPHKVLGRFRLSRLVERSVLPGFPLALGITLAYLGAIVILPMAALALRPWELGFDGVWAALTEPRVAAALKLSFTL